MSAAAASRPVPRIAWSAWWRPGLLAAWAALLALDAVFAIGPRFDADHARKPREFALIAAIMAAFCSGFGGVVIGVMWKEHLCRPIARLAPGWVVAHARVAAAMTVAQVAAVVVLDVMAGHAHVAESVALIVAATALGVVAPFGPRASLLFVLALYGPILGIFADGFRAFAADVVLGARPGALIAVVAAALASAAHDLARGLALDEDHAYYHIRLSLTPTGADALRSSLLMRAMRRWDARRGGDVAAPRPLRGDALAWALHRRRTLQQSPWPLPLAANAAVLAVFAATLGGAAAARLGATLITIAPLGMIAPLLLPAYRLARPLEALRPCTRGRDVTTSALALALVQARSIAAAAAATALLLLAAGGARAEWREWLLAVALAASAMPLTIAVTLVAAHAGFGARVAAVAAIAALGLVATIVLQSIGPAPGWAYGALLAAGALACAGGWRWLIRIDID